MHKARTDNEVYVGANWLSKQLDINRGLIHYWSIKLKLRYFKFKGVRYVELLDALKLVETLEIRFGISDEITIPLKDDLESRKSQGSYENL